MTKKYERACWYCGSKELKEDKGGVICSKCGATWNDLPVPADPELSIRARGSKKAPVTGFGTMYHVTKSAARRAAREREAKAQKAVPE